MFNIKRHCLYIITILCSRPNAEIKIHNLLQILLTFTVQIYIRYIPNLKCKWNVFFYSRIWKSSKNQEDRRLPFLNIFSSSRVITVQRRVDSDQKVVQKLWRNQSKSIKFMTSCAGHVDGMKKWIGNDSSITH